MNITPGKICIKTIIRGMFSPEQFFSQRAALNSPPKLLKVKFIIDNQRIKKYFNKHSESYYPDLNTLRQNIVFHFKGSCIRVRVCRMSAAVGNSGL